MKASIRNILVGILCVGILLVLAVVCYTNVFQMKSGVLKVAEDVNRAEITYQSTIYMIEGEQAGELADFFRSLPTTEYDSGTKGEESGIVVQFFADDTGASRCTGSH